MKFPVLFFIVLFIDCVFGASILKIIGTKPETRTISALLQRDAVSGELKKELSKPENVNAKVTVLAVSNQAYAAQPMQRIKFLALPRNRETVRSILEYHVVMKPYTKSELEAIATNQGFVTTYNNMKLQVQKNGNDIIIGDGARIIISDIKADDGVVHVIDKVLVPPGLLQE